MVTRMQQCLKFGSLYELFCISFKNVPVEILEVNSQFLRVEFDDSSAHSNVGSKVTDQSDRDRNLSNSLRKNRIWTSKLKRSALIIQNFEILCFSSFKFRYVILSSEFKQFGFQW